MPHRTWKFRITDILEAINTVLDYTDGMSYDQFVTDRKTIDAVIRNFIVIGEAASRLPDTFIQKYPDVPWRDMSDMRNLLVHEYFGVDNHVVWDTIKKNVPNLIPLLEKITVKL